jgi:hypothetical protein
MASRASCWLVKGRSYLNHFSCSLVSCLASQVFLQIFNGRAFIELCWQTCQSRSLPGRVHLIGGSYQLSFGFWCVHHRGLTDIKWETICAATFVLRLEPVPLMLFYTLETRASIFLSRNGRNRHSIRTRIETDATSHLTAGSALSITFHISLRVLAEVDCA